MLLKLPHWAIVDKFPAFYDTESATAIEQTARLYAKINELVESYNKYCEDINKAIEDYEAANDKDYNCFIKTVIKLISDYIGMVDLKIIQHDRKWTEYYNAFTTEIIKTTKNIIAELKENGELDQAILEAVGELETKFETFKAEVKKTVTELNDSAIAFKEKLDLQYNNFVDETEQAKENLQTDYEEKKAALDSDYAETKAALETDYQSTKEALENEKQNFITEAQKTFYKYRHYCRIYGLPYDGDTSANNALDIDFEYLSNTDTSDDFSSFVVLCQELLNYAGAYNAIPARGFFTMYKNGTQERFEVKHIYIEPIDDKKIITVVARDNILDADNPGFVYSVDLTEEASSFLSVENTTITRN